MQHIIQIITAWVYAQCFSTSTKAFVTGSGVFTAIMEINDLQAAHLLVSATLFVIKTFTAGVIGFLCKKGIDYCFGPSTNGGKNESR